MQQMIESLLAHAVINPSQVAHYRTNSPTLHSCCDREVEPRRHRGGKHRWRYQLSSGITLLSALYAEEITCSLYYTYVLSRLVSLLIIAQLGYYPYHLIYVIYILLCTSYNLVLLYLVILLYSYSYIMNRMFILIIS